MLVDVDCYYTHFPIQKTQSLAQQKSKQLKTGNHLQLWEMMQSPKVKGCPSITRLKLDQLYLLLPLAFKLCLAACWQDNTGIAKIARAADNKRFLVACTLCALAMASKIPHNTKLG